MVSSDDPFVKTMNLLRLSGANEPQSGVGPKFIFCVGRGRQAGPASKAVVVVTSRRLLVRQWHFAEWQFLINSLSSATFRHAASQAAMMLPPSFSLLGR